MMKNLSPIISEKRTELSNHPLLTGYDINSKQSLAEFMESHVYAVWDFMSLAKSLQHHVCPSGTLWLPSYVQRAGARFVNEMILAEESDIDLSGNPVSHFDLYIQAMTDIGANTNFVLKFLDDVQHKGIDWSLENSDIPRHCAKFMRNTFDIIKTNKPHLIAASFCYGRETVIPDMFKGLINQLDISKTDAPRFHYYLDRHIHIDGEEHGPASINVVSLLCENDPIKTVEAERAAINSINARYNFWTDLQTRLQLSEKTFLTMIEV